MKSRMRNHFSILGVLLIAFNISCLKTAENNFCEEVQILTATLNAGKLFLSDYVEGKIEYVQLESKKECLLGNNVRMYTNDSIIVTITDSNIYLFDRRTGNFIREIGEHSRSPEGYMNNIYAYPYDESRNKFFAKGWGPNSFNEYNIEGQLIKKINLPFFDYGITSLVPASDSLYFGFIWNYDGNQDVKLVLSDSNNKIIRTYPQYQRFDFNIDRNQVNVYDWDGWFYKYNNVIHMYEYFSDTVYFINEQENLRPKYVLKNKEIGAPYTVRTKPDFDPQKYYWVTSIFESDKFLFITYRFTRNKFLGIYNKEDREIYASDDPFGFINNVDNIFPFHFCSINQQNEIIGYQHAHEIIKWYAENLETTDNSSPVLKEIFKIKESDNPVVMIATLKK